MTGMDGTQRPPLETEVKKWQPYLLNRLSYRARRYLLPVFDKDRVDLSGESFNSLTNEGYCLRDAYIFSFFLLGTQSGDLLEDYLDDKGYRPPKNLTLEYLRKHLNGDLRALVEKPTRGWSPPPQAVFAAHAQRPAPPRQPGTCFLEKYRLPNT